MLEHKLLNARICARDFFDSLCEKLDRRIIVPNDEAVMASYKILAQCIENIAQCDDVASVSTIALFEHDLCVASCACTSAVYNQALPYRYCENRIKKYIEDSCDWNSRNNAVDSIISYTSSLLCMHRCAVRLSIEVNGKIAVDLVDAYCKWLVSALTLMQFVNSYSK